MSLRSTKPQRHKKKKTYTQDIKKQLLLLVGIISPSPLVHYSPVLHKVANKRYYLPQKPTRIIVPCSTCAQKVRKKQHAHTHELYHPRHPTAELLYLPDDSFPSIFLREAKNQPTRFLPNMFDHPDKKRISM